MIHSDLFSGYFDWAATAPADTDILSEALRQTRQFYANPSSIHKAGLEANKQLDRARKQCAAVLGVPPHTIIFTSGGTEADYLPILSLLQRPSKGSILITAIEHPAVREQAAMMKNCGWRLITVAPEKNGIVSVDSVLRKLETDTALVCMMAVNNETGAIQPVYELADALTQKSAGKKRPKLHVDAVQAAGKIPLRLFHPGIDTASISAHKLCGPRGAGILYMAQRQEPFIRGGEQENGLRPGTENVFGALSIAACLEKYAVELQTEKMQNLTHSFLLELKKNPRCTIIPEERLERPEHYSPWIVQAAFDGLPGEVMVRALSEKGFYISTGSACSARKLTRPVLEAMQVPQQTAANAVRFSFGHQTQKEQLEALIEAVNEIST